MKAEEWRIMVVSSAVIISLLLMYPYVSELVPSIDDDPFIALGLLNEEGLAEGFPSSVNVNQEVTWNIYVSNEMNHIVYLNIICRLCALADESPNSTLCLPSAGALIFEKSLLVKDEGEALFSFNWSILNQTKSGTNSEIKQLSVNGETKAVSVQSGDGSYKIIIEAWVYDLGNREFSFNWASGDQTRCAWNQIVFQVL